MRELDFREVAAALREAGALPPDETTLSFAGVDFSVARDLEPGIRLRLSPVDPAVPAVLLEFYPAADRPPSYPSHLPFVTNEVVQSANFASKRIAIWMMVASRQQIQRYAKDTSLRELKSDFSQRLETLANAMDAAGPAEKKRLKAETIAVAKEYLSKRFAERIATPDSRTPSVARIEEMKNAFGGLDITAVMESVVDGSRSQDWIVGEDNLDGTGLFRRVLMRQGSWEREVTMMGTGPAKMVIPTDSGLQN